MPFTEAEKRKWHADRQAGKGADDEDIGPASATCGHCGNQFSSWDGVSTADFALCDVCNGD